MYSAGRGLISVFQPHRDEYSCLGTYMIMRTSYYFDVLDLQYNTTIPNIWMKLPGVATITKHRLPVALRENKMRRKQ